MRNHQIWVKLSGTFKTFFRGFKFSYIICLCTKGGIPAAWKHHYKHSYSWASVEKLPYVQVSTSEGDVRGEKRIAKNKTKQEKNRRLIIWAFMNELSREYRSWENVTVKLTSTKKRSIFKPSPIPRPFVVWLQGTTAEEERKLDSRTIPIRFLQTPVSKEHFCYSASVREEVSEKKISSALPHFVEDFTVVLFLSRGSSSASSCLHCSYDSMSPAHYAGRRSQPPR